MLKYLEEIIDLGVQLEENYQLDFWEDYIDDSFLEIMTKSKLFFLKLDNDPLNLNDKFLENYTESFNIEQLEINNKLLKQARNYFDKIDDNSSFWDFIHPKIRVIAKRKFDNEFYADAVETSLKELNNIVKVEYKNISGEELDGARLMQKVFSVNNPVFQFADISTETGRNIQQGYMNIFSGAMIGIRNPKAHNNLNPDKIKSIHLLQIASFMMLKLEEIGLCK